MFTLMDEKGESMQEDAVLALPSEQRLVLETAEQELRTEIGKYLDAVRPVEQQLERLITELRHQAILPVLNREIDSLRNVMADKVQDAEKFARYLTGLADDVLRSLALGPDHGKTTLTAAITTILSKKGIIIFTLVRPMPRLGHAHPGTGEAVQGIDFGALPGFLLRFSAVFGTFAHGACLAAVFHLAGRGGAHGSAKGWQSSRSAWRSLIFLPTSISRYPEICPVSDRAG